MHRSFRLESAGRDSLVIMVATGAVFGFGITC